MSKIKLYPSDMVVKDKELAERIKHKAIKSGYKHNSNNCLIRYGGHLYLIKFDENIVIEQYEYK